jgi:hypothetical protein
MKIGRVDGSRSTWGKSEQDPILVCKLGMVAVIPVMREAEIGRSRYPANLDKKTREFICKITKTKRG